MNSAVPDSRSRRRSRNAAARRSTASGIAAALCLAAVAILTAAAPASARGGASASAGIGLRAPISSPPAWSGAPGVTAEPASAQARASVLAQGTGLSPSDVTAADVCGAPTAGRAECAAEVLVLRTTHARVHPSATHSPTFTQVFPRHRAYGTPASQGAATPSPQAHSPAWVQQAYDLTYLSQTGGVGDTVAIVDAYNDPSAETDLATYRNNYGLPPCTTANGCFRKVNESGNASPLPAANKGWEQEISLDLDAVSAVCPNCHILLVETASNAFGDLATGVQSAVNLGAKQVSNSYGGWWSGAWPYRYSFPGVSIVASTGDHGYLNQGDKSGQGYNNYPASLPAVVAAGGTSLATASGGQAPRGFSESAWALTSSGWGADSGCETAQPKPSYQTDSGCTGRSYSDVSADADPSTGLTVYDSGNGGWLLMGGTSLSTPLIAAYEAVTGTSDSTPQWAYTNSALLNDPIGGSVGTCPPAIAYICTAGVGYDGPTGTGSISGTLVSGAPGIGGPTYRTSYLQAGTPNSLALMGGVYPNGLATTYDWQYGTTTSYGQQTSPVAIGQGRAPVAVTDTLPGLAMGTTYHLRLVATNSAGTTYGYDTTATTLLNGQEPPANTTPPAITGTLRQGQTLTLSTGSWSPPALSYALQWQRSTDGTTWSNIAGATAPTYIADAADVTARLRATVTATNSYGNGTATTATVGPIASGAPASTAPPTITNAAQQGQTLTAQQGQSLTATSGSWNPTGSAYTYQWQRSTDNGQTWTSIANATSATYVPGVTDIAASHRVAITAVNTYGQVTVPSAAVGPVLSGAPRILTKPAVSGSLHQGQVLTASADWNPAGTTYSYLWERSTDGTTWNAISGAGNTTYTPTVADEGVSVRVTVTATNPYGQASATSDPIGPISANPPVNTAPPVVTGTTQRTYTLSSTLGGWTGTGNTYAYQWQRQLSGGTWTAIPGATNSTYALTSADDGAVIRMLLTATNVDGIATQASAPTLLVSPYPPQNIVAPTVSGAPQRTVTLAATQGTWTGPDNTYAYQWQRDQGSGFVNIPGASSPTYTLTTADEGGTVRVTVTATNPDGTVIEASQPTNTVLGAVPANQTPPSISGAAQRGGVLTAMIGVWGGIGNVYAYQWQFSTDGNTWTDLAGKTGPTYTIGVADEHTQLRALITASNPDGTAAVPSAPTTVIPTAPPTNSAAPTVIGTPQRATTLGSTLGSWGGIGNTLTDQWQRSSDGSTWTNISGATSSSYTVTAADEGSALRLLITATNADGTLSVPSAATATVPSAPPQNTAAPVLAGTAQRGLPLSGTQGTWDGIDNSYAYQWQRSSDGTTWNDIAGATQPSYTLTVADESQTVRLKVTASNVDGATSAATAASWTVQASAPQNVAVPTIAGLALRATTLTGAQGAWNGNGNVYANQWQRSTDGSTWTDIAGATDASYTLTAADEGAKVRLLVTASNADGNLSTPSAPSAIVLGGAPVSTSAPTITGTAQRTVVLTTSPGGWSGIANTYSYQWQRSSDGSTWTNITGATSPSYTIGVADEGAQLRAAVTATNTDGSVTAASAPTATVPSAPPVNSSPPALSGVAQRSFTLTASPGSWTGIGNAYTYQWQHDTGQGFTNITGQTSTSYTLATGDVGTKLRVLVTASNPDGSVSLASPATATITAAAPLNTTLPTVTGTPQRGLSLTGAGGSWTGIGNTFAYQWQRSPDGSTWTSIVGATSPTYTPVVADEATTLRLLVTVTNPDGTANAASAPTATVTGGKPVASAAPTISGAATRAVRLAATSVGTWTGVGNTLTRQWQRSTDNGRTWTNIAGQTDGLYTLTTADENALVRLLVTATNPDGTTSVPSAALGPVASAPAVNTVAPMVGGVAQRASGLTSTQGTWTGPDNTYAYQWQRDAGSGFVNVPGATSPSYKLLQSDEGAVFRIVITASNPDGTASATSTATSPVQTAPPVTVSPPTIAGIPQRTMILTATPGTWQGPDNTYAYQWQRSSDQGQTWTAIAGVTGTKYTLTAADENANVRVLVTATNPDGGGGAPSPATAAIQPAAPASSEAPTVGGPSRLGGMLTANPGAWTPSGVSFTYAWQRSDGSGGWQTIDGATAPNYTLAQADVGHTVRVAVTGSNVDGALTVPSSPTSTVAQPPQNTTAPAAPTGTLMDASTLTPDPGAWDTPNSTFAYTWLRCPANTTAVGATCTQVGVGATYTLTGNDVGSLIAVTVAATSAGGTSAPVASGLTGQIAGRPLVNVNPPRIIGNPQVPSTLSATAGDWSVALTAVSYSWQRCDADGTSNCTEVGTDRTYTLTADDRGHTIVLVVAGSSPGRSASAASAPLTVQDQALPQPAALPIISGAAVRTYTLATSPGSWTNSPTTITYQWLRCGADGTGCQPIPGASDTKYVLTLADVAHGITVRVTAANTSGGGTATAKPTAAVSPARPSAVRPPSLTGTAQQDEVLSLVKDSAAWQDTPDTTYATSWRRCDTDGSNCQTIAGATAPQYTLTSQDVGHTVLVAITATNPDGSATAPSQPSAVVAPPAPRWRALPLIGSDPGRVGDVVAIRPGTWTGPHVDTDTVQMMRCTNACSAVGDANASSYTITNEDLGAILRVREYAVNSGGYTVVWSARYVGPVSNATVASGVLADGTTAQLRNSRGAVLAVAALQGNVVANVASARPAVRPASRTLTVRRPARVIGTLQAWACPVATLRNGAPPKCTARVTVKRSASVTIPSSMSGRLRVVVIRRRH